jgi:hypothetical protein
VDGSIVGALGDDHAAVIDQPAGSVNAQLIGAINEPATAQDTRTRRPRKPAQVMG